MTPVGERELGQVTSLQSGRDELLSWQKSAVRRAESSAAFSCVWFESVASIPEEDWETAQDGHVDWDMSLQLLRCVERTMPEMRPRALIMYDKGRPVAAAVVVLLQVDPLMFSSSWLKSLAQAVRKVLPSFLTVRVSICGHAPTAGGNTLRISKTTDTEAALARAGAAMREHAREHRAQLVIFKEFLGERRDELKGLMQAGYRRADSLPDNYFDMRFGSFEAFEAGLRSRYRNQLRRTIKKFRAAGLQIRVVDAAAAEKVYTDEVHQLYTQVRTRAKAGLEHLPADFFRGLCREFPEHTHFTFAYRGDVVVGFICGVMYEGKYYNLFCGFDYALNEDCGIYFNLMVEDLRYALSLNPKSIHMGSTADSFKERLGAFQEPLDFYYRGVGIWRWPLRWLHAHLFPPCLPLERRSIFNVEEVPLREAADRKRESAQAFPSAC